MINRRLYLENGNEIELTQYESYEERLKFCEQLLLDFGGDFEYELPENDAKNNFTDRVVRRLDMLGYYLCELQNRKDRDMVTEKQEINYEKHKKNGKNALFFTEMPEYL